MFARQPGSGSGSGGLDDGCVHVHVHHSWNMWRERCASNFWGGCAGSLTPSLRSVGGRSFRRYMHPIFRNLLSHFLGPRAAKFGILCTYGHTHWKTRDHARYLIDRSVRAKLVVESVTTSGSFKVLYVRPPFLFCSLSSVNLWRACTCM